MTTTPRFRPDGRDAVRWITLALPPGTALLPGDFPTRLEALKQASGLSWYEFGEKIGVEPKQIRRWRKGVEPSGGAMLSLIRFADSVPSGRAILFGESHRPRKAHPWRLQMA